MRMKVSFQTPAGPKYLSFSCAAPLYPTSVLNLGLSRATSTQFSVAKHFMEVLFISPGASASPKWGGALFYSEKKIS